MKQLRYCEVFMAPRIAFMVFEAVKLTGMMEMEAAVISNFHLFITSVAKSMRPPRLIKSELNHIRNTGNFIIHDMHYYLYTSNIFWILERYGCRSPYYLQKEYNQIR